MISHLSRIQSAPALVQHTPPFKGLVQSVVKFQTFLKSQSIKTCDGIVLCETGADRGGHPLPEEAHALRRGDDPGVVRRLPTGAWVD